mmetsp:Transcript_17385/g.29108  ORF Transcript_17385/g.29108 Transcript_17385/m.29108 type:complete len:656 (+) Transcript_17385:115-2082(+)
MFSSIKGIFQKESNETCSVDFENEGQIAPVKLASSSFGNYIPNGILGDMRFVFLSDIHCKQYKIGFGVDVTQPNILSHNEKLDISIQNLPSGDFLIISGDFVETGLVEELRMFNLFLKEIVKSKKFKYIIFICGNHERTIDVDFYEAEGWRYHETKQDVAECREALFNNLPDNVHYLCDSFIELEGLKFYGTPWVFGGNDTFSSETSPCHFRWAYSVTEEELVAKYAQIPDDVDILITHMPPYGIGDGRRNYDKDYFDENERQVMGYDHVGSTSLRDRLAKLNPLIHCYGHIHSGYGAYRPLQRKEEWSLAQSLLRPSISSRDHLRDTVYINAANCDEDYVPIQPALVLDVESNAIPSDDLLPQQQSMEAKVDTAVALLLAIDVAREDGLEEHLVATLKASVRSYLKRVLATSCVIETHTKPDNSGKRLINKNLLEIDELETEIIDIFAQHSLLQSIYACRALCRRGDEDSSIDFRNPQLVVPHLYIGSLYPAEDICILDQFSITHIVNCCEGLEPPFPKEFTYLNLQLEDVDDQDLSLIFIDCIAFIDGAIMPTPRNSLATSLHSNFSEDNDVFPEDGQKSSLSNDSNSYNVYVHCHLGISRSASMVIAYLMFTLQLTYSEARALVKRARPFICPNDGFVKQLLKFESSLRLSV